MADRSYVDSGAGRTYLVEHYLPRGGATGLSHAAGRIRAATERLTRAGASVQLLSSLYVPEDESWLVLYEGSSRESVVEAAREAAIPVERVVEAVRIPPFRGDRELLSTLRARLEDAHETTGTSSRERRRW